MKDSLAQFADQIVARKQAIDAEFAPKVRNHLVQLFRKAHAVDPGLTGVIAAQGSACATGHYTVTEDGEAWEKQAHEWSDRQIAKAKPEVETFLAAVLDYSDHICAGKQDDLPYIEDITLDDLETRTAKRARVWRKWA
jgi:hypothetical protein